VVQGLEHGRQRGGQMAGRGDDRLVLGQGPGFGRGGQTFLHLLGPPAVVFIEKGAQRFGVGLLEGGQIGPARQEVGGHGRGHVPAQEGFGQGVIGF